MDHILALVERWTTEAQQLRERYALETSARLCEMHVRELGDAIRATRDELLTVERAAAESGYSAQHIRAMLASGELENAGRKGRPRIRRAELPRKATAKAAARLSQHTGSHSESNAIGKRRRGFDARRLVAID